MPDAVCTAWPEERQELAAAGRRAPCARTASPDGTVTSYWPVIASAETSNPCSWLSGRVAGRAQRRVRTGDASFRRERAGELLAGERRGAARDRRASASYWKSEVRCRRRATTRPLPAPSSAGPADLELRRSSASNRAAWRRRAPVSSSRSRTRRRPQRQRAADVVVGNRRRRRSRQQLAHRRLDLAGAGQRRLEPRIRERDRRVDAVEPPS